MDDIKPSSMPADTPKVAPEPKPAESQPQTPEVVVGMQNKDKKDKPKRRYLPWYKQVHLSKKQWAIVIAVIVLLLAAGAWGAYKIYKTLTNIKPQAATVALPPPTSEPSRLTGVEVDPELNKRPVTAIIIENSPDARPQSGLYNAGVVFEAIAEGGITRFLALYQEDQPKHIGPVRSARPYFLDFTLPFQAALAHVGGSPKALSQIKSLKVRDLDQFANPSAYWRVDNRYAPHNMYTSIQNLDKVQKAKGYTKSNFTSWPRNKIPRPAKADQIKAKTINFNISTFYYNVSYTFDRKSNTYLRNMGGAKHNDEKARKQIRPRVVIALVMNYSKESNGIHSVYKTTGSGTAYIFQSGGVIKGKWNKSSRSTQISFTDSEGKAVRLNPGQTWVSLVSANNQVSYKP